MRMWLGCFQLQTLKENSKLKMTWKHSRKNLMMRSWSIGILAGHQWCKMYNKNMLSTDISLYSKLGEN